MGEYIHKIKGKKYMLMRTEKSFLDARRSSRDLHGVFGKKVFIPSGMSFNQVRKKSMADLRIKKTGKGYGVYGRPKKSLWFPHMVIMEEE